MEVRNQEGDVVSLERPMSVSGKGQEATVWSNLDGLPPEDEKGLGALCQEAGELVHQDVFDLVGLLDLDAYPYAVDGRLDQDTLVLVARNGQRSQKHFGRRASFDFGDIVPFGRLGCEVGEAEGGRQAAADSLEVWAERLRLGET